MVFIHIAVYMINISIPVSDYCISLGQEPAMFILFPGQTAAMFEPEKNETSVAYCGLSSIACQYCVAYKAYPPPAMREESGNRY